MGELRLPHGPRGAFIGTISIPITAIAANASVTLLAALAQADRAGMIVVVNPRAALGTTASVGFSQPPRVETVGSISLTFLNANTVAATISAATMDAMVASF